MCGSSPILDADMLFVNIRLRVSHYLHHHALAPAFSNARIQLKPIFTGLGLHSCRP